MNEFLRYTLEDYFKEESTNKLLYDYQVAGKTPIILPTKISSAL